MTEANAAGTAKGPGIVLQPEEGESYWQPVWANGYSTVKISPKNGTLNLAMGVQVIAPGGYVREHSARVAGVPMPLASFNRSRRTSSSTKRQAFCMASIRVPSL